MTLRSSQLNRWDEKRTETHNLRKSIRGTFFLPFPRGGKGCEIWYCTVRFTVSLRL